MSGRRLTAAVALSAAALALACSKRDTPPRDAINADLRHDLELASSAGIELAGAPKGNSLQVVSAEEQWDGAVPLRATPAAHAPKAAPVKHRHVPKPKAVNPAPAPAPEETDAASVVADAGSQPAAPQPAAEDPTPAPAESPSPVIEGGGSAGQGPSGADIGRAIGSVIGVVIRGAVVGGVDPCDERVGRGAHGGISEMPLPLPLPGNGGGFPRGGTGFPRY